MKSKQPIFRRRLAGVALAVVCSSTLQAAPLKLGYSDWPGWTVLEIAIGEPGIDSVKALKGKEELPEGTRNLLTVLSFALPVLIWCTVSYVPWLWHPSVKITDVGSVDYFVEDMEVPRAEFAQQVAKAEREGGELPKGYRVNPVYLPAPHEVVRAFYTAFTTPPRLQNEPWLHQSPGHGVRTILLGFLASSVLGVPLGILCGAYRFFSKLQEPFIEFFRYLPAPAFGALCVAILGINDGPKIAIIFIGAFFQQVLVIANTVRKVDPTLVEAAQTLGARGWRLVSRVVIPATITDIYTDMRICSVGRGRISSLRRW